MTGITYTVSDQYLDYTGYQDEAKMRDGLCASSDTVAGTNNGEEWVQADFGYPRYFSKVHLAHIPSTFGGWGAAYLEGYVVKCSDGVTTTDLFTTSGHEDVTNATITYEVPGSYCQYVWVYTPSGYVGVGDFWFEE
jgi:hypothetical protein